MFMRVNARCAYQVRPPLVAAVSERMLHQRTIDSLARTNGHMACHGPRSCVVSLLGDRRSDVIDGDGGNRSTSGPDHGPLWSGSALLCFGQDRRGTGRSSRETRRASPSCLGAPAPGGSRRGCRRTWASRGDRFRNSDGADGCRIASVLLLRDCAFALRQPTGQSVGAGGGLNKNQAVALVGDRCDIWAFRGTGARPPQVKWLYEATEESKKAA
jgi:hypothetical protein